MTWNGSPRESLSKRAAAIRVDNAPTPIVFGCGRASPRGGGGKTLFDVATLAGFLEQVEALFFVNPYQFTDGSELTEALAILSGNPRDPLDALLQALFVTELNHVSGRGLANLDLQAVLISWGESIVVGRLEGTAFGGGGGLKPSPGADDEIQSGLDVFNAINEQRRGDVPDEG